jgi:hypothetical protein
LEKYFPCAVLFHSRASSSRKLKASFGEFKGWDIATGILDFLKEGCGLPILFFISMKVCYLIKSYGHKTHL